MLEEYNPGLSVLKDGFFGVELREGISFEEARELAELLRNNVANVSFTHLK